MIRSQARVARWIVFGAGLALAAPLWACGGAQPEEAAATEERPAPPASAGAQPSADGAQPAGAGAPAAPESEGQGPASGAEPAFGLSAADVVDALAGQAGNVCGAALDRCSATDGCEQIVACAAEHACTGARCYCADARCEAPGPCRSVIDGVPGAASGAAPGASRGPAADAAAAVGACIEGLLSAAGGASGAG